MQVSNGEPGVTIVQPGATTKKKDQTLQTSATGRQAPDRVEATVRALRNRLF
jgi:hypothetical protein